MASALSDDELRRKLQELGENVGPITRTTRKVWEKRLDKAMQEQKKNRSHTITRSNTSHLGHFSSDESEDALCTETSLNHRHRHRRRRTIGSNQPSDNPPYQYGSNTDDSVNFKAPGIVSRTLNEDASKSNTSPSYTSGLTRPPVRTSQRFSYSKLNSFDIDSSDSDGPDYFKHSSRKRMHSEKTSGPDGNTSSKFRTEWSNCIRKDEQFRNGNRRDLNVSTGLNHITPKANGYTSDENVLWNTFKTEDDSRSSTNHSQWISMLLVIGTTLFFVIVGIIYVGVKQKDLPSDQNFNVLSCEEKSREERVRCLEISQKAEALKIAGKLFNVLTEVTGEYQCNGVGSPRLPRKHVEFLLKSQEGFVHKAAFEKNFEIALQMIADNSQWGIKLYDKSDSIITDVNELHDIHALEAVIASKSLRCRIRQAILQMSKDALWLICVGTTVVGTIYFIKRYKRKKLLEEKKMYAVVERIIDILKQHSEKCQVNPDYEPVLDIKHVRDMLIPPAERKQHQQVWEKAVKFLEENESRVRVEFQHVAGEKHKVWRWLPPTTPEVGGKYGKVWQGQAFGNTGKGINTPPYSPSPCLKIRNMFDPEVEYGDDWQVFIKDAILEKCENNNNIVHIKVDVSSNEGCVFLKCTTPEAAGQAYRALHGWWFDRKLVTVKYLRLERYHERFPESKYCTAPLKPSNNMRLSLSAPFHTSALESS